MEGLHAGLPVLLARGDRFFRFFSFDDFFGFEAFGFSGFVSALGSVPVAFSSPGRFSVISGTPAKISGRPKKLCK